MPKAKPRKSSILIPTVFVATPKPRKPRAKPPLSERIRALIAEVPMVHPPVETSREGLQLGLRETLEHAARQAATLERRPAE